MNDFVPLLDLLPQKFVTQLTACLVIAGIAGRIITARRNGETWASAIGHTLAGTNTPNTKPPRESKSQRKFIFPAVAVCGAMLFTGCAFVKISDPASGKTIVNAAIPAWPWQDSSRTISGIAVTSRTNYTRATLTGLDETQTTSTNAVDLVRSVVGAAVGAALSAAK